VTTKAAEATKPVTVNPSSKTTTDAGTLDAFSTVREQPSSDSEESSSSDSEDSSEDDSQDEAETDEAETDEESENDDEVEGAKEQQTTIKVLAATGGETSQDKPIDLSGNPHLDKSLDELDYLILQQRRLTTTDLSRLPDRGAKAFERLEKLQQVHHMTDLKRTHNKSS